MILYRKSASIAQLKDQFLMGLNVSLALLGHSGILLVKSAILAQEARYTTQPYQSVSASQALSGMM